MSWLPDFTNNCTIVIKKILHYHHFHKRLCLNHISRSVQPTHGIKTVTQHPCVGTCIVLLSFLVSCRGKCGKERESKGYPIQTTRLSRPCRISLVTGKWPGCPCGGLSAKHVKNITVKGGNAANVSHKSFMICLVSIRFKLQFLDIANFCDFFFFLFLSSECVKKLNQESYLEKITHKPDHK